MSARMAKTCASFMKLGPSDAMRAVSFLARSRCVWSETKRGGPATIHRRRSRRNAMRKGDRRYQTTKIRRIMGTASEPQFAYGFFQQRKIRIRCRHSPVLRFLEYRQRSCENRFAVRVRQAENPFAPC